MRCPTGEEPSFSPVESVLVRTRPHIRGTCLRQRSWTGSRQTYKRLELHQLQIELRQEVARLAARLPAHRANGPAAGHSSRSRTRAIFYLSYRAPPEEAGPEKIFDLSRATGNDRWRAGEFDMAEALRQLHDASSLSDRGCALIAVRRTAPRAASA